MTKKFNIMIVEDEKLAGKALSDSLVKQGYKTVLFANGEEALLHFKNRPVDLVLLDYKLPGMTGEAVFERLKAINPLVPVIFMTAYSSVEKAVKLLKMGAYTYLTKPIEMTELVHNMRQALERSVLLEENRRLREGLREKFSFEGYVFNSEKIQGVMSLVQRSAQSSANILLTGESGTGKEVIAGIIHSQSRRSDGPFVRVNLAALPETLIEAELFGSVKGAYTGSVGLRAGKFEEAHGGTLFLDEIGELSLDLQVKLLRVIQEREVVRLGSNESMRVDIRLITATNRDLQEMVRGKGFREDLYFRLNVVEVHLPALRERKEDIELLIDLFIRKYNLREGKEVRGVSREALHVLMRYDYPGNIRELENIIERAVVLVRGDVLMVEDLPVFLDRVDEGGLGIGLDSPLPLPERMAVIEREIILGVLRRVHFNQSKAAVELGVSESGLRYKMQTLGIKKE